MDWNLGYTARYYLAIVDPNSWKDIARRELLSGSIKRSGSDLMQSADITSPDYAETEEKIIRMWMDVSQDGESSHIPLFTGYAATPTRDINGTVIKRTLQCYSVLKPASDVLLERGWYAPVDIDGTYLIKQLLKVTGTKVHISEKEDKKRTLTRAIIAEGGETNLSMTWKILDAMNWRMRLDGLGEIWIEPYSRENVAIFDMHNNDIVEPTLTIERDWYNCPNVLRVVIGDEVYISRDEDEEHEMSIPRRGREVWTEETSPALNDRETGQDYADRRLKELQRVSTVISYDRRYDPDVFPSDIVYINYPIHEIDGKFYVGSQTITLGYHAKTAEEVYKL